MFIIGPVLWFLPPIAASYFYPNIGEVIPGMSNPHEGAYVLMGLSLLPKGLSAILVMVVFGATLSSMDTAMTQNSAIMTMNIYKPLVNKDAGEKELFLVGRIFNVIFGLTVFGFAIFIAKQDKMDLFDLNVFLGSTLGISMAVPFFLLYWVKKAPKWAALVSMLTGVIYSAIGQHGLLIDDETSCAICKFLHWVGIDGFNTHEPWSLQLRVFGVSILGGGVFLLTTLFWRWVKPEEKERITAFYNRMNTPIDVEKEVVGSEDMRQLVIIGAMVRVVGAGIFLLVLIPNPWNGRLIIACTALAILAIGQFFYSKGKKSEQKRKDRLAAGDESCRV